MEKMEEKSFKKVLGELFNKLREEKERIIEIERKVEKCLERMLSKEGLNDIEVLRIIIISNTGKSEIIISKKWKIGAETSFISPPGVKHIPKEERERYNRCVKILEMF